MRPPLRSFHQPAVGPRTRWRPFCLLGLILLVLSSLGWAAPPAAAQPQTKVWLGRSTGTEYVFDVALPADFAAMATCSGATYARLKDRCKSSSQAVNGQSYSFVSTKLAWDKDLIDEGAIAFQLPGGGVDRNDWFDMQNSAEWKAFTPNLKAQAAVKGTWKYLDLMVLVSQSAATPTVRLPIPELTLIKTRMSALGAQTVKGLYYPTVKIPADLAAFQEQMLAYGNVGRRDPDFRKTNGSTVAKDLSGDTVQTGPRTTEKVFKQNTSPPYFPDHVLSEQLNQAAQFYAEYLASINRLDREHKGPASYRDPRTGRTGTMLEASDRSVFFGGPRNVVEAAAAGGLGDAPHSWMAGDTHFRPWFNVDGAYPQIGYGAAMSANGTWYFVAVPVIDKNPIVAADPQIQLQKDYGLLYNAYAANSPNLCPTGWRVPTQADFQALIDGVKPDAHLKLSDPAFWGSGTKATNASGFSARPAGGFGGDTPGGYDFGMDAYFWSSTPRNATSNVLMVIHAADAGFSGAAGVRYGFSIRCISAQAGSSATSVKDADGNTYKTVRIGQQLWMAENLRTTKFADGKPIPTVTDNKQWVTLTSAAYVKVSPPAGN